MNNMLKQSSFALAAALTFAAAPISSALADTTTTTSTQVQCFGLNACKGQGACKSTLNTCKGQNACKGKGATMKGSAEECTKAGGSTTVPAA